MPMSQPAAETAFSHGEEALSGVLLTNLGTPQAPTRGAVRRYLAEFLSDPRVIEVPRVIWLAVLQVILIVRPGRSARAYRAIWTEHGSPLLAHARRQAELLDRELGQRDTGPVKVALGMRYGQPSIAYALETLRSAGARRIVVLPLYPQYSATTTGSTFDAVAATLRTWRWLPELRFLTHYHDHPGYIEALVDAVKASWDTHGRAERLLYSFHGLPQRYFLAGDPYPCECRKTARLVSEALGLGDEDWDVSFQSRVGREPWLKPYTDELLGEWASSGVRGVDVISPGFSADCLETLEEIDMRYRDLFLDAGGEAFHYIPALNDQPAHIRALADLLSTQLGEWARESNASDATESAARAERLGAGQ